MKRLLQFALVTAFALPGAAQQTPVWETVSCGDNSTYAVRGDGTLWAWGDNEEGQLGIGSTDIKFSSTPVQMGSDSDWKAVYGARGAAFALKQDGSLWAVGSNEKGMSGTGDGLTKHTSLTRVGTDNDWTEVYSSINWCYTVFAQKADGSIWGWGDGSSFTLGTGNANNSAVPVQIGTDTDWKKLSVGASHVLALKENGELWGWGFAAYHQLMNSTEETSLVRVPTRLDDDIWSDVWAIDNASYGVHADGLLWGWGDNAFNILGINADGEANEDGALENIQEPVRITNVATPVTMLSGCEYVRVVVTDGKTIAWGANANGALGNGLGNAYEVGDNQFSYTAVEVLIPEGAVAAKVSNGQRFTAWLDTDGNIYGWGSNRWGQMGNCVDDSNLTFCPTPITMGVPAPAAPGEYTFGPDNIPSSLADAVKITMTGEWNTSALKAVCAAIGANLGFPPVGNNKLESVDMSQATIAPNTSFYVDAGMQKAGIFKMCHSLKSVKWPANETAANITDLQECFMNCEQLTGCDVSALTGVQNIKDAFYNTALTVVNMSAWENVTKSEDAFGHCAQLTTVILPAEFTVGKYLFNTCTALRLVDWSLYPYDTAPVIASDANVFEHLEADQQYLITVMVPEAAFESFMADATWAYVNLQPVAAVAEGEYHVDAASIPSDLSDARVLYLNGNWDTAAFKALSDALGNNSGTVGNSVLETVDMSQAAIAVGTNLNAEYPGILWGTVTKGIFQNCTALTEFIVPADGECANIRSIQQAFQGCTALETFRLAPFTGLTNVTDAFYGCSALTEVSLPGNFAFAGGTFDRCNALSLIDWSRFEGTVAPAFKSSSLPSRGKQLTIQVPQEAYDSFVADAAWNGYDIQAVINTGVGSMAAPEAEKAVYDLTGRRIPVADATSLPAGIYIVDGRKMVVK